MFCIGYDILGIERAELEDKRLSDRDSEILVVLDSVQLDDLSKYYNRLLEINMNCKKLVLVDLCNSDELVIKNLLIMLVLYRNYNIYRIEDGRVLDKSYVQELFKRNPGIEEIQSYIIGDISAFADMSRVVLELRDALIKGDIKELNRIVSENDNTILGFPSVLNAMQSMVDMKIANSNVNVKELEDLKDELKDKLSIIEDMSEKEYRLNTLLADLKRELGEKEKQINFLSENKDGFVMRNYVALNTSSIKCKVNKIIYFKEVSYVRYFSTLLDVFVKLAKLKGAKVKVLVYDNNTDLNRLKYGVVTTTDEYTKKKSSYSQAETLLIVEPGISIIQDILVSGESDVVVIYDRLGLKEDIVRSNIAKKYYIVNSKSDYNIIKENIIEGSNIVVPEGSSMLRDKDIVGKNNLLELAKIDKFTESSESAKVNMYKKSLKVVSDLLGDLK